MAITIPAVGDSNWGPVLNTALTSLDTRTSAVEAKFRAVPSTAGSTGVAGQIAYDSTYLYICVATNTWKRVALSTWS